MCREWNKIQPPVLPGRTAGVYVGYCNVCVHFLFQITIFPQAPGARVTYINRVRDLVL
jgi:hypothetical protein